MLIERKDSDVQGIRLRPLISYVLSSYSMANGEDYFRALLPLFSPIAYENDTNLFDPHSFSQALEEKYGLHVNEQAVRNFVPSMAKEGLLRRTTDKPPHIYRYSGEIPPQVTKGYEEIEKRLSVIFDKYHTFIENMNSLMKNAYTKDQLETGLIEWVLYSDAQFDISQDYRDFPQREIDYIAAAFLEHLEANEPNLLDDIALIHSGAIMSELVLDYKSPQTAHDKASTLHIFLDAPFVMNLLDLSGKRKKESSVEIFNQLQELGSQLYIFEHSIEEIEGTIDAVLNPSNPERRGPLAEALFSGEVNEDYVRVIRRNLLDHIKGKKIKPFSSSLYKQHNLLKYFSEETKDRLYDEIPWGIDKDQARKRDVESISAIMRKRGDNKQRDYMKSGYLFVTNNESLARLAREFCIKEGITKEEYAPPAISVVTLSGLLFLMLGDINKKKSISRKQLLASCSKVVAAHPKMIESVGKKLREFAPEQHEQIRVILSEPRTKQEVMRLTWGNTDIVTQDNIETFFEDLKDTIAEEQNRKHKDKIHSLENDLSQSENTIQVLQSWQHNIIAGTVSHVHELTSVIVTFFKYAALFSFVGYAAYSWIDENNFLVKFFSHSLLIFDAYLFFAPPNLLPQKLIDFRKWAVCKRLSKIGLDTTLLDKYSIDWGKGTAQQLRSSLLD